MAYLFPAATGANQLTCKGSTEVLHFHPLVLGVMLAKNVGICDRQVKQEPEDILVVLSTLQPHMIITMKLIISINSTHVSVVQ